MVAGERLDRAQRPADLLGRDDNLRWTAFGPTNVAVHRVPVAAELGVAPTVPVAADLLGTRRLAPALRSGRVQVGLDVAWAHTSRRHDADAVLALVDVERRAPGMTRHNVCARSTISTLLGRARGSTGGHVRSLAVRERRRTATGRASTSVACGAPLAGRARDVRTALTAAGWSVGLVVAEAGSAWAGGGAASGPRADVVVACPLTFNTANGVVSGIMDTPASGALRDALGAGRLGAVPMVNARLGAHPIRASTIDSPRRWGVALLDPSGGRAGAPRPVAWGTGAALAAVFDPSGSWTRSDRTSERVVRMYGARAAPRGVLCRCPIPWWCSSARSRAWPSGC